MPCGLLRQLLLFEGLATAYNAGQAGNGLVEHLCAVLQRLALRIQNLEAGFSIFPITDAAFVSDFVLYAQLGHYICQVTAVLYHPPFRALDLTPLRLDLSNHKPAQTYVVRKFLLDLQDMRCHVVGSLDAIRIGGSHITTTIRIVSRMLTVVHQQS